MTVTIISRTLAAAAVALAVWGPAAKVHAVQLWGVLPAQNEIVRVDPATGAVFGGFTPPGGTLVPLQMFGGLTIAEEGAVLLYQNPEANPTSLFRINPDAGTLLSAETMPAANNPDHRAGLSFESGAGAGGADAIFAINNGLPMQRQDGYGDASLSDHSPNGALFAGALGGDDNGRHFLVATQGIREFDPSTPNVTLATLPLPPPSLFEAPVLGLAFDGQRIYMSDSGRRLFTIDPDTGAVLHSVLVAEGTLIGLAARFVPEPSAGWLMITGVFAGLAGRRSRTGG